MNVLRWLSSFFRPPPDDDEGGDKDGATGQNAEALKRAWVRDQILDARISLLEKEVYGGEQQPGR